MKRYNPSVLFIAALTLLEVLCGIPLALADDPIPSERPLKAPEFTTASWTFHGKGWKVKRKNPSPSELPSPSISRAQRRTFRFELSGFTRSEFGELALMHEIRSRNEKIALAQWWQTPYTPIIPYKSVRLLVPYNVDTVGVTVTPGELVELPEEHSLKVAEKHIPPSEAQHHQIKKPLVATDVASEFFPLQPAGDVGVQIKRGYRIFAVNLFPLQFRAKDGRIRYYKELTVEVELRERQTILGPASGPGISAQLPPARDSESILDIVETIDNADDRATLASYEDPSGSLESGVLDENTLDETFEYVIITSDALRDDFLPLATHRASRGLTTRVVTVETDIYPNYSGTENQDDADKIRHFIQDAYANHGTRWVLLGGDIEIIPKRGVYVSMYGYTSTDMPSDSYFACLDGPWNFDGDQLWAEGGDGEDGSSIDFLSEVYVGRAPASNVTEVQNFVSKVIQYESGPHPNATTALYLGESLDTNVFSKPGMDVISELTIPSDWSLIELYDKDATWSGSQCAAQLQASPNIVTHRGHSNYTYNARISNGTVSGLTNTHPYFMYSEGCQAGGFDMRDLCIAEQHVVSTHGAVGVIMNARYGFYSPLSGLGTSYHYQKAFWEAVANKGKTRFGVANQFHKGQLGTFGYGSWVKHGLNLLGDPYTPFQGYHHDGEISGILINDENENGIADPGESALADHSLYLDLNNNGQREIGSHTLTSTGNSLAIPSDSTLTSNIDVSTVGRVLTDIDVTISLESFDTSNFLWHTRAVLIGPAGQRILLFGPDADDGPACSLENTTFDDEATIAFSYSAPCQNPDDPVQPIMNLSRLDLTPSDGTWQLEITNGSSFQTPIQLHSWSIRIITDEPSQTSDSEGAYLFSSLQSGSYRVRAEAPQNWSISSPSTGYYDLTHTYGAVAHTGNDFFLFDSGPTPPPTPSPTPVPRFDELPPAEVTNFRVK